MTMTLVLRQPQMPTIKPAGKKLEILPEKPVFVKKERKKPKHKPAPKPRSKKNVKTLIQPAKKDISKAIPDKSFDKPKTLIEAERIDIKTVSKEAFQKAIGVPSNQIVRKAIPLYRINPLPKYPGIVNPSIHR